MAEEQSVGGALGVMVEIALSYPISTPQVSIQTLFKYMVDDIPTTTVIHRRI